MMYPEFYDIIAPIRHHGTIARLISNGYYFQPEKPDKIKKLNEAGLDYLQISIDDVNPDEVLKKSLKVIDNKLKNLAEHVKLKGIGICIIQTRLKKSVTTKTISKRYGMR